MRVPFASACTMHSGRFSSARFDCVAVVDTLPEAPRGLLANAVEDIQVSDLRRPGRPIGAGDAAE